MTTSPTRQEGTPRAQKEVGRGMAETQSPEEAWRALFPPSVLQDVEGEDAARALAQAVLDEAFRYNGPCQASGLLDCGDGSSATACWEHKLRRRVKELGK